MTAGHNALRGSGPGQKPPFDNAMAHVEDRVIKLRKAIDALDRAIENRWGQAKQASKGLTSAYRPVAVEKAINNPDDLDGLPGG